MEREINFDWRESSSLRGHVMNESVCSAFSYDDITNFSNREMGEYVCIFYRDLKTDNVWVRQILSMPKTQNVLLVPNSRSFTVVCMCKGNITRVFEDVMTLENFQKFFNFGSRLSSF